MTDDFAYLNARVRSLKGLLLSPEGYRTALECASLEEVVIFLESTPYAAPVEEALTLRKGIAGVEEGLRRDFQNTIDHVQRIAGGRARELLAIVLGRWEIFNLKTVLRGRHSGAGIEAVLENAVPFGRLDEVALQELARQPDLKAAIDLLAQWRIPFAPDLRRAYPPYRERGDFSVLEVALDRSFFAVGLRGLDESRSDDAVVADSLRREIDLILLGFALRVVHHGMVESRAHEYFIPGGKTVTPPVYEQLCAARNVRDFIAAVPVPAYASGLAANLKRYLEYRRLFALNRVLQACFLREMMRWVARDPLSIAFTIGYLWRKANEITNLRLIARGKHAALPRDEIEALMTLAG